jgi:5'-3' exoribonuclease 1
MYPTPVECKLKPRTDMAKASTIFPSEDDPSAKAKEIRAWLVTKGVRDFEPVPLQCDQLDKVHSRAT